MASNSFGHIFKFTSFGESHGKAIGCIVDGIPPLVSIKEDDIQHYLDRRKPGQSKFVTQRKENDKVEILSGVFEGKTTGHPIALHIKNEDQRSKDYSEISQQFRPGHADITYQTKYGIRDYRGGGRSSARETAVRVAAGAIAFKVLEHKLKKTIKIRASVIQMGPNKINKDNFKWNEVNKNPFFCGDQEAAKKWEIWLDDLRKEGNSVGAIIEIVAENVPKGLGSPIYKKLDTQITEALMSINAVKGVEIGSGFNLASLTGEEANDEIFPDNEGGYYFGSNHSGGILGGISSGQPIIARFVVKPTSSILTKKNSINSKNEAIQIKTRGRHDPCVGIRAVPVAEAMLAITLLDQLLEHESQIGAVE
ncbi:chorismate synthase [Alphaproteobacteria bacterium]|nr:chorismate synthase [Alphaproteobacteria bacterium]